MISDFLSGDSQCAACGALANFMCSACKGVHYCSTQCQVRIHTPIINHLAEEERRDKLGSSRALSSSCWLLLWCVWVGGAVV